MNHWVAFGNTFLTAWFYHTLKLQANVTNATALGITLCRGSAQLTSTGQEESCKLFCLGAPQSLRTLWNKGSALCLNGIINSFKCIRGPINSRTSGSTGMKRGSLQNIFKLGLAFSRSCSDKLFCFPSPQRTPETVIL